jgi:hypothetical protein
MGHPNSSFRYAKRKISQFSEYFVYRRLEQALYSLPKAHFFCIDDFDLDKEVTVTIEKGGNFVISPSGALDTYPGNSVRDFLVRTALHSHIEGGPNSRQGAAIAAWNEQQKKCDALFDETECNDATDPQKIGTNSVFNLTSFTMRNLYQYFCPNTESFYDKSRDKKKAKSDSMYPEMFQIILIASGMLKHLYQEACLQDHLNDIIKKDPKKNYEATFGSQKRALRQAHFLEASIGSLPLYGSFDPKNFRRVMNTRLAAISSFLAYAIYDQRTFNLVTAMLQTTLVQPCTNSHFKQVVPKVQPLAQVNANVELKSYLFSHETLEYGNDFVDNVVLVANQLANFLYENADFGAKKPYLKKRIGALFFRTLCSDLVDIYVGHSCYPNCSPTCAGKHPWLTMLQDKPPAKKKPVELILDFIIVAIQRKAIKVAPSHIFSKDKRFVTKTGESQPSRHQADIRYLFHLIQDNVDDTRGDDSSENQDDSHESNSDASEVDSESDSSSVEAKPFQWLKLPEVVNVILFGRTNPCVEDPNIDIKINWSTKTVMPKSEKPKLLEIPSSQNIKGKVVKSVKVEKKKKQAEADADADADADNEELQEAKKKIKELESKLEEKKSLEEDLDEALHRIDDLEADNEKLKSGPDNKKLQKATKKIQELKAELKKKMILEKAKSIIMVPGGTKNDQVPDIDRDDPFDTAVYHFFDMACTSVLQLINQGTENATALKLHPRYNRILDSIVHMSASVFIVTTLQQNFLQKGGKSLVVQSTSPTSHPNIPGIPWIEGILNSLQRICI